MKARQITLSTGSKGRSVSRFQRSRRSVRESRKLTTTPKVTGNSVTSRMLRNMPLASTAISAPESWSTSSGVTKGERTVETVVMPTE